MGVRHPTGRRRFFSASPRLGAVDPCTGINVFPRNVYISSVPQKYDPTKVYPAGRLLTTGVFFSSAPVSPFSVALVPPSPTSPFISLVLPKASGVFDPLRSVQEGILGTSLVSGRLWTYNVKAGSLDTLGVETMKFRHPSSTPSGSFACVRRMSDDTNPDTYPRPSRDPPSFVPTPSRSPAEEKRSR